MKPPETIGEHYQLSSTEIEKWCCSVLGTVDRDRC